MALERDPIDGTGTVEVFKVPNDTTAVAVKVEGDAFPRFYFHPVDGLKVGDGAGAPAALEAGGGGGGNPHLVFRLRQIDDAALFGCDGTVALVAAADAFAAPITQSTCVPAIVAAGGKLGRMTFYSPIDVDVDYVEVDVSNLDGTERIQFLADHTIAVPANTVRTILPADWGDAGIESQTGSDLSMDVSGNIITAAGGTFFITGIVGVTPV